MRQESAVYITGLGGITACGHTLEATWQAILEGKTGIAEIKTWELNDWPVRLAGEIKEVVPASLLPDRKLLKLISRQDVWGLNAAMQAVENSGLLEYRQSLSEAKCLEFNEATGIYVGSPGNKYYQQYDFLPLLAKTKADMAAFGEELFNEVHPMWLLKILPNNVLAYSGITYGFKGPNHNISNHAVGGIQALLEAYHAIKMGQAERALVVAYDLGFEPQALFYYDKLGLLSQKHLKPFDKDHDGSVLAEAGVAVLLESEASAKNRGAHCYAELLGGFSLTEGAGLFSIQTDAKPLEILLKKTLTELELDSKDIDMIVAHGNGNPLSDDTEALALGEIFKKQPPTTAFKWALGHSLTASGLLDLALSAYALDKRCIPGVKSLETLAPSCQGLNLSSHSRVLMEKSNQALVLNRGFASMNASVALRSCV